MKAKEGNPNSHSTDNVLDIAIGDLREEFRESEQRYRDLFNQALDGIFISDPADRIQDVNPAGCRMLGMTIDELCRLNLRDLLPPEEFAAIQNRSHGLKPGNAILTECHLRRKDGSLLPVEVNVILPAGGGLQGIVRDFTEQKRTREELRKSAALFRQTFDLSPVGKVMVGLDLRFTHCNNAFCQFVGYNEDELIGREFSTITFSDDTEICKVELCALLDSRISLAHVEKRYVHKDGKILWGDVTLNLIRDENAHPLFFMSVILDVTERKAAESSLRDSEEHLQMLMDLSKDMISFQTGGIIQYMNRAGLVMHGATSEKQIVGRSMLDLIPPENREQVRLDLERIVASGELVTDRHAEFQRLDGSRFEVELSTRPFLYHGVLATMVNAKDVSNRLSSERALISSEMRYRRLFEAAQDGILILDEDTGEIVDVNPFMVKLLGFTREEFLNKSIWDIGPLVDVLRSKLKFEKLQDLEYIRYDNLPLKSKDGQEHAVEFISNVYDVEGKKVIQCNIRDITARKRVENALRDSEEKYRAIFDHAQDAILVRPVEDGKISNFFEANTASCKILGYTREELLEMSPIDLEPTKTQRELSVRAGNISQRGELSFETTFRTKKGDTVLVEVSVHRFTYRNQPMNVAMFRDISAHRRMEEQLRQSQKMEAVGRLAGGVAHDFNNMLTIILGHTEILMMQMKLDNPFYGNLKEILSAGERSAELTKQLLAFSRKQTATPRVIKLDEVVLNGKKMLGRLIGEEIDLKIITTGTLWNIRIDPVQVDQILANLMINARDAIKGVGSVTIELANTIVDKEKSSRALDAPAGEYVMMAVRDTGVGMDAATAERIFEPFFTTKAEGQGTGLGLSTVFGIVKQNRGIIHVYSEPGLGTTFNIYFPRFLGKIDRVEKKEDVELPKGNETILIVEDEKPVMNLVKMIIEEHGYKVLFASDPGEALTLAEQYGDVIHLLLTDIVMPTMNGKELDEKLRKLRPAIKTLFMSGYTSDIIAERGLVDEGVNFIHKPISHEALVRKVREVLDA